MTDLELLELAAKAAGVPVSFTTFNDGSFVCYRTGGDIFVDEWNPLTDDGDAMRLMVKLRLSIKIFPVSDDEFDEPPGMIKAWRPDDEDQTHVEYMKAGNDYYAATRRAIVRAAAKIGRQMP